MSADLIKWLFERAAIFGIICVVCLTVLRAMDSLSDSTFSGCFTAVVAAVFALNFLKPETPK